MNSSRSGSTPAIRKLLGSRRICRDSLRIRPASRRSRPPPRGGAVGAIRPGRAAGQRAAQDVMAASSRSNSSTSAMKASSSVGSGCSSLADAVLQLVGRALGDDAAPVDQADAVAILGLVEEVRRHHHRDAPLDHGVDVRPELAARQRVDARGRLVEKQHRRVVHDRAGQGQPLLEAQRQLAGVDVEIRLQSKRGRSCARSASRRRAPDSP